MAKSKGWIKVHRQIWDSDVWKSPEPFDARSAWIDLLLMANHEDAVILIGGKPVTLKKGQLHTSVKKLATRWRWNPKKVRRFLGQAKGQSMVSTKGSAFGTTITIENYTSFQGSGRTKGSAKGSALGSAKGSQTRNIKKEETQKPLSGSHSGAPGADREEEIALMGDPIW